ncbi:MAG: uracil-DNA glycosylase [Nitrospinae bacterium]|nr:uracil-DNA glycosylase [Nitrospinota bacterium]
MKDAVTYFKYLKTIGVEYVEPSPATVQALIPAEQKPAAAPPSAASAPKKEEPAIVSDKEAKLAELAAKVTKCKKCPLHKTRTQTVFGSGNPNAEIMFVGEAPGADEDEQGLPFVGRAGKTLTKMIEEPRVLGMKREEVYIANVLKCRPPNNRPPEPGEVAHCEGFLKEQIALIRPAFICALGAHAAHTLLKTNEPIGRLRGKWFDYEGVPLIATYHPSFLNRSPEYKKEAWKDLLMLKDAYQNRRAR